MTEKVQGLDLDALEWSNVVTKSEEVPLSGSFNISWLGSAGATNGAAVEQQNYDGREFGIEVVVTGTPTWGTACVIGVTPKNCELKSGVSKVEIAISGANLGQTFLSYLTPKSTYKGQTVKYAVAITGAPNAILYARGDIGSI